MHCERDSRRGMLCEYTHEKPEFDERCPDFAPDPQYRPASGTHDPNAVNIHFRVYEEALKKQNLVLGTLCGVVTGGICVVLWPAFAAFGGIFFIGLPVITGVAIGLTIRYTGRAITPKFGLIAAIVAVLCCCAGFFLAYLAIFAYKRGIAFDEVVRVADYNTFLVMTAKLFRPGTAIAYFVAALLAYKFAFRKVNVKRFVETL